MMGVVDISANYCHRILIESMAPNTSDVAYHYRRQMVLNTTISTIIVKSIGVECQT